MRRTVQRWQGTDGGWTGRALNGSPEFSGHEPVHARHRQGTTGQEICQRTAQGVKAGRPALPCLSKVISGVPARSGRRRQVHVLQAPLPSDNPPRRHLSKPGRLRNKTHVPLSPTRQHPPRMRRRPAAGRGCCPHPAAPAAPARPRARRTAPLCSGSCATAGGAGGLEGGVVGVGAGGGQTLARRLGYRRTGGFNTYTIHLIIQCCCLQFGQQHGASAQLTDTRGGHRGGRRLPLCRRHRGSSLGEGCIVGAAAHAIAGCQALQAAHGRAGRVPGYPETCAAACFVLILTATAHHRTALA